MDQWYIARGKVKKGPFPFAKLQAAAAKGGVHATDLLLEVGTDKWIKAPQVPRLFPAAPAKRETAVAPPEGKAPVTPTMSPPAVVVESPTVPASRRSRKWLVIAAGIVGVSLLVGIPFLIFGGKSSQPKTVDPPIFNFAEQNPPSSNPTEPPAPDQVVQEAKDPEVAPSSVGPTNQPASPGVAQESADPKTESPSVSPAKEPAPDRVVQDIKSPELELPPVGRTEPPALDSVMLEFKAARAVYATAMRKARSDLRDQFPKIRKEIQGDDLDPKEKAKSLKQLDLEQGDFKQADSSGGPLPTHPAMQSAVAEYFVASAAATRTLGDAADKGLTAYEKAGVTDAAKLRPLEAARLAGQHPELVGIWEANLPQPEQPIFKKRPPRQTWRIGVDEESGDWLISGFEAEQGFQPKAAYYGRNIQLKGAILTFFATPVDEEQSKPRSGAKSSPKKASPSKSHGKATGDLVTLKLHDGELQGKIQTHPKPTKLVFHRTDELRLHVYFDRYEKKTTAGPLDAPTDAPDVNNANYVWHRVAKLAAFASYPSSGWTPLEHETLYLPYGSGHLIRSKDAGRNKDRRQALLSEYESLSAAPHPYLKRMTDQAAAICRSRLQLALADDQYGNTPASSIRAFRQDVFMPALEFSFQRDVDYHSIREAVQREHPNCRVIVTNVPMSEASREKLDEFLKGAGGLMEDVKDRARVSALLTYADMAQIDFAANFWQTWLLPLARRCGGPVSNTPLVSVEGLWRKNEKFQRLSLFKLQNVSGQDLTHVVFELIAENEWGEKAAHYYYFDQLDVADFVRLVPHLRWENRRLDFTNTMTLTWSLWADQGSEVNGTLKLESPTPNPDPDGWRKDYLKFDDQFQAKGEALGAVMQNMIPLPSVPGRQQRLLLDAAATGMSYAFCLPKDSNRTLVLRFLRFDQDGDAYEAEIFDLRTRTPFDPQTPIWKGNLNPRLEAGISFEGESDESQPGWAFVLMRDDKPTIFCPTADKPGAVFPARTIPLLAVEVP